MAKKFWMVLRANGSSTSSIRHETLDEAKKEAARLCTKEKQEFYVLEAVEFVEIPLPDVDWQKI